MAALYNQSIDNVDLWPGGILETHNNTGQLFTSILRDQFTRIRAADRFWYANLNNRFVNVVVISSTLIWIWIFV